MDFEKIYGAEEAQNCLTKVGRKEYEAIYGYGEDEMGSYNWRKRYDHKPAITEVRSDIESLINERTDAAILTGFSWRGVSVYLSTENQFNFKASYDLAVQTQGATLPVKFKLGEDGDGTPVYHVFSEMEEFEDFYTKAISYVNDTLNAGWQEKDSVDYNDYIVED